MNDKNMWRAYLALAIVCIVWGTTYLALRVGVVAFPPFLFSAIRQISAGIILLAALGILGKLKIRKQDFLLQLIPGILMIALGNGVIGWSERYIPSGLAALIVSVLPVYVVAINFISGIDRKRPNYFIIWGLILGCAGIVLMFRDNLNDLFNPEYLLGMLIAFGSCLAWAVGSVFVKHKPSENNVLTNAAIQMFIGGIVLLLMSFALDDYSELKNVTTESIWALVYLTLFGSVLAYSCFVYILKELPIGVASLYAYVNPFIALFLGFLMLDESLTWITFFALAAVLAGMYMINKGYKLQKLIVK